MHTEILLYDGFDELDACGPFEVLANGGFEPRFVTLDGAAEVTASHGARVAVDAALSRGGARDGGRAGGGTRHGSRTGGEARAPADGAGSLLIVPGGGWGDRAAKGAWAEAERGELPAAIVERHRAGATVASVCTGAMLLAAGGLLSGRPAVTHHVALNDLEAAGADVIRDARVVDDGDILTAGGVTSGIDLALWLVERERGQDAADLVAAEIEHTRRDVHRTAGAAGSPAR